MSLATPLGPARYGRAFWLAVKFAVGHALLLSVGAGLVLFFGWQIPARFEQEGSWRALPPDCFGLLGGWLALSGRLHAHAHAHPRGDRGLHSHWHLHIGRGHSHRPAVHTALPGVMGAVFATSGLRALMLSLPLWDASGALGTLLVLVSIFALGILISMSLFGIVLAHVLSVRRMTARLSRFAAAATAFGSLVLGIYWITAR